jgi:hypothetical protein
MVLIPPLSPRRWGQQLSTKRDGSDNFRFWQRYESLRKDWFSHDEAMELAKGKINTPDVNAARIDRRVWIKGVIKTFGRVPTDQELDEAIADLYATTGWADPWEMIYPEGHGVNVEWQE